MKVSYEWLQSYFDTKLPAAADLEALISIRAFETEGFEEVGDDYVIDIDVLPNRAHDALSHEGIAKELSIMLEMAPTEKDRYELTKEYKTSKETIGLDIQESEKCRRYSARIIRNVQVKESPEWLRRRLESVGQKSINNIVDATNYVMLDLGQPLHAFNLDKIDGKIVVRNAKEGEVITTLSGEEKTLKDFHLVIADEKDALAIAGVKGGKKAEVDGNTKNIVIECANFDPVTIRKTARRLNILTDSSKRFENDLTPEITLDVMERITALVVDIAHTESIEVGDVNDVYTQPQEQRSVSFTLERCNQVLGLSLEMEEVLEILIRFGFEHNLAGDTITVDVPRERLDLIIAEDLFEEIGRVYGYELIEAKLPIFENKPTINKELQYRIVLSNILVANGYSEVMTYGFRNKGEVKMKNPIASDKKYLRTTLSEGLGEALEFNLKHKEYLALESVQFFEFGHVFCGGGEHTSFALGWSQGKDTKEIWKKEIADMILKISDLLGVSLDLEMKDNVWEINFTKLLENLPEVDVYSQLQKSTHEISFVPVSQFPVVTRDIAVWVPGKDSEELVESILEESSTELLAKPPRLVDSFEKDGRMSLAYRLVFQAVDRTLTDEEILPITEDIYSKLSQQKDFEVR